MQKGTWVRDTEIVGLANLLSKGRHLLLPYDNDDAICRIEAGGVALPDRVEAVGRVFLCGGFVGVVLVERLGVVGA